MDPLRLALSHHAGMWFGVLVSPQRLVASAFSGRKHELKDHLCKYSQRISNTGPKEGRSPLADELAHMFDGDDSRAKVEFELAHVTSFQKRVHGILTEIPKGRVTTYGYIASALVSGPRAVGNAVGSNPWPLFAPCHRVVPSSGLIGEYSMNGIPSPASSLVKRGILEREGVHFIDGRIASSAVWHP